MQALVVLICLVGFK